MTKRASSPQCLETFWLSLLGWELWHPELKARKAAKHPQYAGKLSHPNVNTAEVGNPDLVQSQ